VPFIRDVRMQEKDFAVAGLRFLQQLYFQPTATVLAAHDTQEDLRN